MQSTLDEQEIIVRGSEEHKEYLEHRHGWHLEAVNRLETRLAIWGRPLLLAYVVYTVVKAALIHALPTDPVTKYTLLGLDAIMLLLQVLGLEGSMSGLLHLADEMESSGKTKEASNMRNSSAMVQWMLGATAVDLVLQATPHIAMTVGSWNMAFDTATLAATYTNILLITRVIAVGFYLTAMARMSHRGPKVISQREAEKRAEEKEQKQIRIDNANIMSVFSKAIEDWMKRQPDLNASFADSTNRLSEAIRVKLESIEATQNDRIDALSRFVESIEATQKIDSRTASATDLKSTQMLVESILNRSLAESLQRVEAKFESRLVEVSRQFSRSERSETGSMRAIPGKAAKEHEKLNDGLSFEAVIAMIEADPTLANLSDAQLASKVGTSKSTANRAKKKYNPESA